MTECVSCLDPISDRIEYQDVENGEWKSCNYCKDCIEIMKQTQFLSYVNQVKSETCKKSLRRLLVLGPPVKIREPVVLPSNNSRSEVYQFRLNNQIFSSDLENVYTGDKMVEYLKFIENYLLELNDI